MCKNEEGERKGNFVNLKKLQNLRMITIFRGKKNYLIDLLVVEEV